MYNDVSFNSEGAELRGRHYRHPDGPKPTVVMTHGTTATITMAVDQYAEAIFGAGFDVLLYDHKNFGLSGGEPRQEINPWIQTRTLAEQPHCFPMIWFAARLVTLSRSCLVSSSTQLKPRRWSFRSRSWTS